MAFVSRLAPRRNKSSSRIHLRAVVVAIFLWRYKYICCLCSIFIWFISSIGLCARFAVYVRRVFDTQLYTWFSRLVSRGRCNVYNILYIYIYWLAAHGNLQHSLARIYMRLYMVCVDGKLLFYCCLYMTNRCRWYEGDDDDDDGESVVGLEESVCAGDMRREPRSRSRSLVLTIRGGCQLRDAQL